VRQLAICGLFVSLVYCGESTVRWFVVREKHCWMAADSADKSKRTWRWCIGQQVSPVEERERAKKKIEPATLVGHLAHNTMR
jgi:hypothetical protein